MRHHNVKRRFGRVKNQREALMAGLARSLVLHEKIKTTEAKAKEIRPFVEKLVTKAKKSTLSVQRDLIEIIGKTQTKKIVEVVAPKYKERNGGYTRITKLPPRKSDGSPMAVIEFV